MWLLLLVRLMDVARGGGAARAGTGHGDSDARLLLKSPAFPEWALLKTDRAGETRRLVNCLIWAFVERRCGTGFVNGACLKACTGKRNCCGSQLPSDV